MKHLIPSEHKSNTISHIIVVAAGMAMLAVLIYFEHIWKGLAAVVNTTMPFLVGFGLAFLQLPIIRRVEWLLSKTVFRRKALPKLSRAIGAVVSLLTMLLATSAFLTILLPQMIASIESVISYVTAFLRNNIHVVNDLLVRYDFIAFEGDQLIIGWEKIISEGRNYIDFFLANLKVISSTIYTAIFQALVGLIAAFYMIMDKERFSAQAKKVCYALFTDETCYSLIFWTRKASRIFSGFIAGKILDSLIIGALCYLGMLLLRMEYAVLISVIVGITNVIPFFGPFIGAIPSILILLVVNPMNALWFAVWILILQQIDGNIIGPLILGDYVGISSLWIMISIVIGGGLFGFAGMLLSVPVFALAYAFMRASIESRLRKRGLPVASADYANAPEKWGNKNAKK